MSNGIQSYVIWRTYGAGFWSIVASTLAHCDIAEQHKLIPVVDMKNHPTVYQERQPIEGSSNFWEYYFEQPGGRSLTDIGHDPVLTDGTIPKGYPREIGHETYRELWKKYAQLKTHIADRIGSQIQQLSISQDTLGVHFRGQEMRTATGHKFPPTLSQMNAAISHVLENHDFDRILVVTEAQQYLDALGRKWGNRIVPSPTFRLRYQNAYRLKNPPRQNHRFELGFEALQDAHLLAACGGYICGHSGLSEAAILLNDTKFQPLIRISQGRNSFRPYVAPWLWYAKAVTPPILGGFSKWVPASQRPLR